MVHGGGLPHVVSPEPAASQHQVVVSLGRVPRRKKEPVPPEEQSLSHQEAVVHPELRGSARWLGGTDVEDTLSQGDQPCDKKNTDSRVPNTPCAIKANPSRWSVKESPSAKLRDLLQALGSRGVPSPSRQLTLQYE